MTKYASFLVEFDTSGAAICGSGLANLGVQSENGVASDNTGTYVYTASTIGDTTFCGPDTLLDLGGGFIPFLGRWQNCATNAGANPMLSSNHPSSLLYPNPNNGKFTIKVKNEESVAKSAIEIYNVLGERVYSSLFQTSKVTLNEINLSSQTSGMYLYRIINEKGQLQGEGKFIIEK